MLMWWHWLLLGFVLIALEIAAAGGFYIIFFGIAAVIIAFLELAGIVEATWLQFLLFSVLSVLSLLLFRNPIMRRLNIGSVGAPNIDTLAAEKGSVIDAMAPGADGKVELRGTSWSARNVGTTPLSIGARIVVVREERLTLLVKAEEAHR